MHDVSITELTAALTTPLPKDRTLLGRDITERRQWAQYEVPRGPAVTVSLVYDRSREFPNVFNLTTWLASPSHSSSRHKFHTGCLAAIQIKPSESLFNVTFLNQTRKYVSLYSILNIVSGCSLDYSASGLIASNHLFSRRPLRDETKFFQVVIT